MVGELGARPSLPKDVIEGDATSPIHCCARWPTWRTRRCKLRWTGSLRRTFCFVQGLPPDSVYHFKHTLMQDVVTGAVIGHAHVALSAS
jgi:hypothetical protein